MSPALRRYVPAIAIFATGLLVRIFLIHIHPIVFGGDTILRLANRDRIVLAYQLPLLQAIIHYTSQIGDGLLAVRYAMALIGAAAGCGFYLVARDLLERRAAFWASLLFVSNPFLIQLSIVPYQEVLMLGSLLFAFHFFFRERWIFSSIFLGLACLTRYEAWVACPVMAVAFLMRRKKSLREVAKAVFLFGWAPLAWVVYNGAISAGGTFVIELPASPFRVLRYVYLGWITVKSTPIPALLLAIVGAWTIWKSRALTDRRVLLLASFFGLFLLAILFSAHGEAPDPERFVTAREATLLIAATLLTAGFALNKSSRVRTAVAFVGVVLGIYSAHRFIVRDTSTPQAQLCYQLAQYLDARLAGHERAVVLTKPIPPNLVEAYLSKALKRGGEPALHKARVLLMTLETTPPEYQRTFVHSRFGKNRIISLAGDAVTKQPSDAGIQPDWVAVWSDFEPSNQAEARLYNSVARDEAVQVFQSGGLTVTVYRLNRPVRM
jgi:hypothetical protein